MALDQWLTRQFRSGDANIHSAIPVSCMAIVYQKQCLHSARHLGSIKNEAGTKSRPDLVDAINLLMSEGQTYLQMVNVRYWQSASKTF
jgi:hypothetical protein